MQGPGSSEGTKQQGDQSPLTPARHYRVGLTALDKHCHPASADPIVQLPDEQKDAVLKGLEAGTTTLDGVDGKQFFTLLLRDTQHGFFADPGYGGNKDMVAWKMIGFPGARYDYRDWVHRHNERYRCRRSGSGTIPNWKP